MAEDDEEYKLHALGLKDKGISGSLYSAIVSWMYAGNEAFQEGDMQSAIELYSQAIDLDPDNHVFYSNRSAAYMKSDSISKALRDAEKCVELAPNWSKGYNRLGVAQQGLKRFPASIDSFKRGIELDPDNRSLWSALRAAEEAYEADKKVRFEEAARERAIEEEILRQKDLAKKKSNDLKKTEAEKKDDNALLSDFFSSVLPTEEPVAAAPAPAPAPEKLPDPPAPSSQAETTPVVPEEEKPEPAADAAPAGEDDLLAGFFSELSEQSKEKEQKEEAAASAKQSQQLTEKYTTQDLGTAKEQHARLTCKNYEWKNQNPFYVMQLDIDATEEDIKYRYRKLSAKIHPDKLRDVENSRLAFEELKEAYHKLCDKKQRDIAIMNIEHVRSEVKKERRKLISKGMKESELPPLEEVISKRTMKHFADMYLHRKKSDKNLHAHNARERMFEDQEKEQQEKFAEFDKEWSEGDRREKRVGNWRGFQEAPDAKKVRASSYKEESRAVEKHGQVKLETWKKKWK